MSHLTISEFADKVNELMPVIMREYVKIQGREFYKLKITMPQFFVMDILNHNGETKMTDLAGSVNVTTAAMTGIVDRLVRDGYLIRVSDPEDRRIIKVKLTSKGSSVVRNIIEKRKELTMKMFGAISQEDRIAYLNILTSIKEALERQV